ncbi:MAG: SPASM domain-containing protein, partial [Bacteroidia bacterium]|nr:SPASM domain-containing protein [Bacteroidia bacterium]
QGISLKNVRHMFTDYWPQGRYMLKNHGWKSWYNYWYTKLFICDEGGEYDFKWPVYRRFPWMARRPYKIEVEHTTVCNKKCIFCAHTHWDEEQKQMSYEQFKYLVDSIPSLKWLNLAGIGSMFLNKDVLKILEYAHSKSLNVNFVDEFDFFTEEHARKVVDLGVNSIYISFDAARKETYETIKKGCDYDKALNNIRTLLRVKAEKKSDFPVIHFRYLINKLNYQELPEYVDLIADLINRGIRARLEYIGLIVYPEVEDYYIPLNDIPEDIIVRTYENAVKHNINLHFSHAAMDKLPAHYCARWSEPFVLVTGEVIPCCAVLMQTPRKDLRKHSFGNVFERPFMEIWRSKKYRDFRKRITTKDGKMPIQCRHCCVFDVETRENRFGIAE